GPLLERQLRRVGVRQVDEPTGPVRADVTELAPVRPRSDVRHDIEFLTGLEEGRLEGEVVARGYEQLMRNTTLAQHRGKRGEEAMDRRRRGIRVEERVQLVVQRP